MFNTLDILCLTCQTIIELKEKEVRQMMEHIIKSLATKDTATVILVLGLVREARLWHKQYLAYKLKDKELKKK